MIKIKIEKKKRANRGRRASKEKGRKKEKIGCLAKKQHAFEKKRFPTFLWKSSLIITSFWKMCLHLKGECCENFPGRPKWTWRNAQIDKRTYFGNIGLI